MDQQFNKAPTKIMHIDLNSCFAMVDQQAHPHLRGKPVVVAAYNSPGGFILSNSIEARRAGVKSLMRVKEAREICPSIIVRTPNTSLIRDVHLKFRKIFNTYSDIVIPKSIDEAIIDFTHIDTEKIFHKDIVDIAKEIKYRMKQEIGEWITCSIGISTNRFLAKTGASLTKPDGLEVITYKNVRDVFGRLELLDIYGINVRNKIRLNRYNIMTSLQFFDTPLQILWKQVFKSILGYYWFRWFRGWEEGTIDHEVRRTYGQQYALKKATRDPEELNRILMKLCEKMGRRMRRVDYTAQGVHVSCVFKDQSHWHMGRKTPKKLYTTLQLYHACQEIFNQRENNNIITKIAVNCFNLEKDEKMQDSLFQTKEDIIDLRHEHVSQAMDALNNKYGEFTVTSARMMEMNHEIIDRIAFGGVKEIEALYEI